MIYDTHAHYDDAAFDDDRAALLAALPERNVGTVINAATDPASAERSIAFARQYPYFRAAVGVHPECIGAATEAWLAQIEILSQEKEVCAIGEIGLDYHYPDGSSREEQLMWFRAQLALANRRGLPVIVHDRDAHEDTLQCLREYRPRGVVHCFSGSVEMMREVVEMGMYIGLGGTVTFKNARRPVEVAAAVPAERFLLETDAPYMAPEPMRGRRCDSSMIAYTAARIAQIRGIPADEVLRQAWQNAEGLFGAF
mgnify:CR=1 FL=1